MRAVLGKEHVAAGVVCLFAQYCHFATLEKLRLCEPLPRTDVQDAQLSRYS